MKLKMLLCALFLLCGCEFIQQLPFPGDEDDEEPPAVETPTPTPSPVPTLAPTPTPNPTPKPTATPVHCIREKENGKKLGSDWRKDQFLWKPIAEHYNGVAVLSLPSGKANKVTVFCSKTGKNINMPHRSTGTLGDIFQDLNCNGTCYEQKCGLVHVTVTDKGTNPKSRMFKLGCPSLRSDGK